MCDNKTPPPITRYEMVEVSIPAAATNQVALPDVPALRNQADQEITILDIEIFPNYAYSNSYLNSTITGFPVTEIAKSALVFYIKNEESIRWIPTAKLIYTQNPAVAQVFQMQRTSFNDLKEFIWPKGYFKFSIAPVGGPYIIPMGITYLKRSLKPNG